MIERISSGLYGLVCYVAGLAALGYTAFWLVDLVPNALDAPRRIGLLPALAIDLGLIALFALQHSGMARPAFKRVWTRIVPTALERSTYVLASALAMGALFLFWEPLGVDLWRVQEGPLYIALLAAYGASWLVLVAATFMIDHFDLFGLRQVWKRAREERYTDLPFATRGLYRVIRHPIYLGWLLVFWVTPVMTASHLFFAVLLTAYVFKAIVWEERDLVAALPEYEAYREAVPALVPRLGKPRPIVLRNRGACRTTNRAVPAT